MRKKFFCCSFKPYPAQRFKISTFLKPKVNARCVYVFLSFLRSPRDLFGQLSFDRFYCEDCSTCSVVSDLLLLKYKFTVCRYVFGNNVFWPICLFLTQKNWKRVLSRKFFWNQKNTIMLRRNLHTNQTINRNPLRPIWSLVWSQKHPHQKCGQKFGIFFCCFLQNLLFLP